MSRREAEASSLSETAAGAATGAVVRHRVTTRSLVCWTARRVCARVACCSASQIGEIAMTKNERPDDGADTGFDVHVAERYLTQPAIDRRLPEHSREPRTAVALLKSETILDGDPAKNLATFVTTFMEPEAVEVIAANLHRNFIDHAEYPRTAELAKRCVRILHGLLHRYRRARRARHRMRRLLRGRDARCAGDEVALEGRPHRRGQADRPAEPGLRSRRACRLGQVLPLLRDRAAPGAASARALHRRRRRAGPADRREHDRGGRHRRYDVHR